MPYSSVSDVPDYVPSEHRKDWLTVFNSAYRTAQSKGKPKEDADSYAFAVANSRFGPKGRYAKAVKLDPAAALYFPPVDIGEPEGACCENCFMFFEGTSDANGSCAVVEGPISGPNGVCGLYVHGEPDTVDETEGGIPKKLSKDVASYTEQGPTKCGNCEFFDAPAEACEKVSGLIEAGGCCSLWEPFGSREAGLKRVLVYEESK